MKIYEALKDVLTEDQLKDFEAEVKKTIDEAVEAKSEEVAEISEEYVAKAIAEKEGEIREAVEAEYKKKLDEAQTKLDEKEAELEKEYRERVVELTEEYKEQVEKDLEAEGIATREKFEKFTNWFYEEENRLVEALNRFLDDRISEKISDKLIKESVVSQEALALLDGIKVLFEEHYSGIDATAGIKKMRQENKELKEAYEQLLAEKADISQKAENAAIRLLISEKTRDLSEAQAKKVMTYFEGRDFDFVQDRIDDFIVLTESEDAVSERKARRSERRLKRLDEVKAGFLPEKRVGNSGFFDQVSKYM